MSVELAEVFVSGLVVLRVTFERFLEQQELVRLVRAHIYGKAVCPVVVSGTVTRIVIVA